MSGNKAIESDDLAIFSQDYAVTLCQLSSKSLGVDFYIDSHFRFQKKENKFGIRGASVTCQLLC